MVGSSTALRMDSSEKREFQRARRAGIAWMLNGFAGLPRGTLVRWIAIDY